MNIKANLHFALYLMILYLSLGSICAEQLDLDISNGYRQDSLSGFIRTFNPPPSTNTEENAVGSLISKEHFKVEDIGLYQLGVKGKWTPWGWLARVEGDYGWGNCGKFHEVVKRTSTVSTTVASLHKARTKDLSLGAGYLFSLPFIGCFSFGPVVGWSYHYQYFRTDHPITNDVPSTVFTNLKYGNRWMGPWLGFEAAFRLFGVALHAGYAYHWVDWKGKWKLASANIIRHAVSERYNSYGNVIYCEGRWNFYSCFNVGVSARYQEWKTQHGNNDPQPSTTTIINILDLEVIKVKQVLWHSFSVMFDAGFTF